MTAKKIHSYVFETGWDSEGIKWAAWSLAHREGFYLEYFSTYPNNLLLLRLAQLCTLISLRLGATEPGAAIEVFAVINVIFSSVALLLVYGVLSRISSVVSGVIGLFLAVLLLGTSPWASIMYSDALLLGLPPLAIALIMYSRGSKTMGRCLPCFCLALWWALATKSSHRWSFCCLRLWEWASLSSWSRRSSGPSRNRRYS